ncbi:hypothetical protein [Aeromonas veronii]|uniref:hypothetical protein n=1 Tax=Aeromonas veronii TaxID=654 RepID=UPI001E2E62FD|nr:hypothetical protein [Aeromonas veronii]MCD6619439.1 hypothetical protein [Aeromonas veronii]
MHFWPSITGLNPYNDKKANMLNIKTKMLFFLGSVLFLVIGLPLLFFVLGPLDLSHRPDVVAVDGRRQDPPR